MAAQRLVVASREGERRWTDGPTTLVALTEGALLRVAEDVALLWEGRVDNRDELCPRLGLDPAAPDSEVVLAGWRRWGERLLDEVVGELGGVVLDRQSGRLTALRDLCASRPVHLATVGQGWAAGSELADLLPLLPVLRPDPLWVVSFLTTVLEPDTAPYTAVRVLVAGHAARPGPGGWRQRPAAWWRPREVRDRDAAEALRDALDRAVADRLPDRAHAGVALSGGIDSCSVAASAAAVAPERPATALCWPFDDEAGDERAMQERVARLLGMPLRWVDVSGAGPTRLVDGRHPTDVFGAPPRLSNWFLHDPLSSAAAETRCGVVLTGEDADSALGGTGLLHLADLAVRLRWRTWWREASAARASYDIAYRRLVEHTAGLLVPPWLARRWSRFDPAGAVPPVLAASAVRSTDLRDRLRAAWPAGDLRAGRFFATGQRGVTRPEHLQQLGDDAYVLYRERGVAVSTPLLDRRLLDLTAALPWTEVFRDGVSKVVLRRSQRGRLPDDVRGPRPKAVLSAANRRALQGRDRESVIAGLEACSALPAWFEPGEVRALREAFVRGDRLNEASRVARLGDWLSRTATS